MQEGRPQNRRHTIRAVSPSNAVSLTAKKASGRANHNCRESSIGYSTHIQISTRDLSLRRTNDTHGRRQTLRSNNSETDTETDQPQTDRPLPSRPSWDKDKPEWIRLREYEWKLLASWDTHNCGEPARRSSASRARRWLAAIGLLVLHDTGHPSS